jgi:hypothetical protein
MNRKKMGRLRGGEVMGTKLGSQMYPGPHQTMSKQLTPFYMLSSQCTTTYLQCSLLIHL